MELTVETSKTKDTLGSKWKILISKNFCELNYVCVHVYFFPNIHKYFPTALQVTRLQSRLKTTYLEVIHLLSTAKYYFQFFKYQKAFLMSVCGPGAQIQEFIHGKLAFCMEPYQVFIKCTGSV